LGLPSGALVVANAINVPPCKSLSLFYHEKRLLAAFRGKTQAIADFKAQQIHETTTISWTCGFNADSITFMQF
jgi:hypothetical protein